MCLNYVKYICWKIKSLQWKDHGYHLTKFQMFLICQNWTILTRKLVTYWYSLLIPVVDVYDRFRHPA